MYEKEVEQLQNIIDDSKRIVFFGGAGVSTESNIPDFRSADGLYQQKYKYSPEQIVSHSFFVRNPEGFYEFYKEKMMFLDAKPNAAHLKLAELEEARIADASEVLRYLTSVMRGEVKDQFDLDPSLQDRTKAAELLGKGYRLFVDKQEISGKVEGVTIINDIPREKKDGG